MTIITAKRRAFEQWQVSEILPLWFPGGAEHPAIQPLHQIDLWTNVSEVMLDTEGRIVHISPSTRHNILSRDEQIWGVRRRACQAK